MTKLIICGSRSFNDYSFIKTKLDVFFQDKNKDDYEIVSGGALGVDKLAELYAKNNNIKNVIFLADWRKGKQAGPIRNQQMVDYSDEVIAFWDSESKGTKSTIDKAKVKELKTHIIKI